MRITRRAFLRGLGGAAIAAGLPLSGLLRSSANALYGPLVADPAGLLDLPAGFSYVVVDRRFGIMSDGYRIPFYPDGMGVFSGPGGALILMRNHEIPITGISAGPYLPGQTPPREAYSATAYGAVTRVVVDPLTLAPISSNLVLTGTVRNCGGGETPYGWLSCEETGEPGHGYVFLCDPAAATVQRPQRIDGFGRFAHEGAAMDPLTEITYLTEDISSSPLYRFVPSRLGSPFRGELQAMRIVGMPNRNTSLMRVGEIVAVDWVPVADPSAALESTSAQAFAGGAAVIRRGEGIWFQGGSATFASTSGGTSGLGQIFRHDPGAGTLELLAEGADPAVLDMPDNLTVAPWGDVYIAEDGPRGNFMRILSPDGSISTFARNAASAGELAGPCFSPDGRVLFLNLWSDGITVAITGPFDAPLPPDAGVGDGGIADGGVADAGAGDGAIPEAGIVDGAIGDGAIADASPPDGALIDAATDARWDAAAGDAALEAGPLDGAPADAGPGAADGGCGCRAAPGAGSGAGLAAATLGGLLALASTRRGSRTGGGEEDRGLSDGDEETRA